jgi:hypothetical protein
LVVVRQKREERDALEKQKRKERLAASRERANKHREQAGGQRHQYQPLKTTMEGSEQPNAEL